MIVSRPLCALEDEESVNGKSNRSDCASKADHVFAQVPISHNQHGTMSLMGVTWRSKVLAEIWVFNGNGMN